MQKLKALFIPHRHNQYRPAMIKGRGLLVFAIYIVTFQTIFNFQNSGQFRVLGYATDVNITDLLTFSNNERSSNGLASYAKSVKLTQAAQAKANHMIANDYWAHYAPDGTSPWDFINKTSYSYTRAGENLAYGFSSSSGVLDGWMNSSSHRANVLDAGFTQVGFGIANGNFQGGENTVIVAMYGEPYVSTPTPAAVKTTSTSEVASTPAINKITMPPVEKVKTATVKDSTKPKTTTQKKTEDIPVDTNNQRLLARLSDDGGIVVTGEASAITNGDGKITNIQALFSGQAHWSLYMVAGGMLAMAMIYFIRHLQSIAQVMVHGEHYVIGHPTLEASVVYLAIWLILFATYGAVI